MTRKIAFFDFDDTLVRGDSLVPFLARLAGWPRLVLAAGGAALGFGPALPPGVDKRGGIKLAMLRVALAGRTPEAVAATVAAMAQWPRWNQPILDKLLAHKAAGDHIVIASGGLALYLPTLLRDVPHDALLCTAMEVVEGRLTGEMQGGNCVRDEKARRVEAYLKAHGPFERSIGYGNAPHDLPMLALLDEQVVV